MRVEQSYRVRVLRIGGGRVDMVEGVLGVWVGAVLGIVKRFMMFELVCRGLEKESWQMLVSRVSTGAQRRAVLGRFSSSMIAACRELGCKVCV